MKYSKDKRIEAEVKRLIREGWEPFRHGGHPKLRAPFGHVQPIPSTPSDHRSAENWLHQVRRAERNHNHATA